MSRIILAWLLFITSAATGQPLERHIRMADSCYKSKDYNGAFLHYAFAAEAGHHSSILKIGKMVIGKKVDIQDSSKVISWFTRVATDGNTDGYFYLGVMYYDGLQVKQDYTRAIQYYQQAIRIDSNASSLNNLAVIYQTGIYVKEDDSLAFRLFKKAADKGIAQAIVSVGYCYLEGSGTKVDYVAAKKYFEKGVANKDCKAMYALGGMYDNGDGMPVDYLKARKLYQQAIDSCELPAAMYDLGGLYEEGLGIPVNKRKAMQLYVDACYLEYEPACPAYRRLKFNLQ